VQVILFLESSLETLSLSSSVRAHVRNCTWEQLAGSSLEECEVESVVDWAMKTQGPESETK
jgi:hypothetical protein